MLMPTGLQDLLPTEFAGAAKSGTVAPMKANASASAYSPLQSALHATPQPGSAPLSTGIQVIQLAVHCIDSQNLTLSMP